MPVTNCREKSKPKLKTRLKHSKIFLIQAVKRTSNPRQKSFQTRCKKLVMRPTNKESKYRNNRKLKKKKKMANPRQTRLMQQTEKSQLKAKSLTRRNSFKKQDIV